MIEMLAVALLLLAVVNAWLGRSILYPPTLFSLAWAGYMIALSSYQGTYFAIAEDTLLLFFAGALAVSLGGALELLLESSAGGRRAPAARRRPETVGRMIDLGIVLVVLSLPLRVARLRQLGGGALNLGAPEFWVRVRQASIAESNASAMSLLSLTDNAVLLALFVALAAVAHDVGRRRIRLRTLGIVVLALLYQVSTASRASGITLVCGLIGIAALSRGRWTLRSIAYGAVAVIAVFSFAAVLMGKGGSVGASLVDNVRGVTNSGVLYAVGPIVAFDRAFADPASVPGVWSITYSVAQVANKLGAGIELPSIHAVFTRVGPGSWMNAYTIYFAYVPDLGVGGALSLLLALGAGLSWLFRRAVAGSPHARLIYATMIAGIVMSGFAEYFFMSLSFYVKAALCSVALYGLPPLEAATPVASRGGQRFTSAPRREETRPRASRTGSRSGLYSSRA